MLIHSGMAAQKNGADDELVHTISTALAGGETGERVEMDLNDLDKDNF